MPQHNDADNSSGKRTDPDTKPSIVASPAESSPTTVQNPPPSQQPAEIHDRKTAPAIEQPTIPKGDSIDTIDKKSQQFNRSALLIALAILSLLMIPIIKIFVVPLILAATFTTLLHPLYKTCLRLFKNNRVISSLACCLTLLLGLLVPLYVIVHLVTLQAIDLYTNASPYIQNIIKTGDTRLYNGLLQNKVVELLHLDKLNWSQALQDGAKVAGRIGTSIINKTSTGIIGMVMNVFIMLFTMFYFLIDGEKIVQRLRYLSPLRREYEDMLFFRFLMISRATVRGTLLIGVIQGLLGGITLYLFGIKAWLLWSFIMVLFSIIPVTGTWMVMIPTAVVQMITGHLWKGIAIALITILVISSIDNLMRPRLVGKDAKLHDLIIFFSTIGGISVFGIMGFIAGPVIAALFHTILDIYGIEYRKELTSPYTGPQT